MHYLVQFKRKLQLEAQALDHGQLKQIDVKLLKRGEYQPRRFIHEHDLQVGILY